MVRPSFCKPEQVLSLSVVIGGKKYEMETTLRKPGAALLTLGDYQGALISDVHETKYEFSQTYQLLMPDGTAQDFLVVGQSK